MRYVLAAAVTLVAAAVMIARYPQDLPVSHPLGATVSTQGVDPIPTGAPEPLTRAEAVEKARGLSRAMGELSPRLVDVREVSFHEALARTDSLPREANGLPPDERRVYLVKMKGAFEPLSHPREAGQQIRGTMFLIADAVNGRPIGWGIRGDEPGRSRSLLLRLGDVRRGLLRCALGGVARELVERVHERRDHHRERLPDALRAAG